MDKIRNGRFTSSGISALMSSGKAKGTFGKPFYTYVEEKYFETKLLRRLDNESNAKPTSWGKLVERHAFDQLGTEYNLVSQETIVHPSIGLWAGSPDLEKYDEGKTVCDIKCPMTLKSFCTFYECETIEDVRDKHKDGEDYYWQLVSNSILLNTKYAELIIYVPYYYELVQIRELANNYDGDQNKVAWINWAGDDDLPYIPEESEYKNLKVIRFEVPESDKKALTERVNAAISEIQKMLLPKASNTIKTTETVETPKGDNDLKI